MEDWKHNRVGAALTGTNPTVLARLQASFAVIGDVQFLPGYSVAISDTPGVDRLTDLPKPKRRAFLADMELLGDSAENVCAAQDPGFRRINLEILGNTDHFLHAHIWPRYDWEPAELVGRPVWLYDVGHWRDPTTALGE